MSSRATEPSGALVAAKIIGETVEAGRFQSDAQFARLAGVAPIDASSGEQRRHRLSRHGNRQLAVRGRCERQWSAGSEGSNGLVCSGSQRELAA